MRKKILLLVVLVSVAIFIFSGIHVFCWWLDNSKTTAIVSQITTTALPTESSIDFNALKGVNSDTAGWIRVKGTSIDYPYVKTKNNDFYLNHTFDKSGSGAGWPFMDYRNSATAWGRNNVIYAHGRVDGTMFGTLKNILGPEWQGDKNNFSVQTLRPAGNNKWQVFSVYKIPTTDDYLRMEFANDDEFVKFGEMLKGRSVYDFGVALGKADKILTLSTCYNDAEKVVLHAKLVE